MAQDTDDPQMYRQVIAMLTDRMDRFEKTQDRMAEAIERQTTISERVAGLLVKFEEHGNALSRAFDEIAAVKTEAFERDQDKEQRLRKVEEEMPVLRLTKGWVIAFTVGGTAMMFVAVVAMVLK